jgi:hypothetical protein
VLRSKTVKIKLIGEAIANSSLGKAEEIVGTLPLISLIFAFLIIKQ